MDETNEASDQPATEEPVPPPLTLNTALGWLAAARKPAVLEILRADEFAKVSRSAFAGFRVNSAGYDHSVVRQRLATEILQNDELAQKMRALAEQTESHQPRPRPPTVASPLPVLQEASPKKAPITREKELKAERDQRRQERDQARELYQKAESDRRQAETACTEAAKALEQQTRIVQQQQSRIDRLDRQIAQIKSDNTRLQKALRAKNEEKPVRPLSHVTPPAPQLVSSEAVWSEAVLHMLNKGKADIALTITQDVLRTDSENISALKITARSYEQKGMIQQAGSLHSRLLGVYITRAMTGEATETLVHLITLLDRPEEALPEIKQWLGYLRHADPDRLQAAKPILEKLRASSPATHLWLASHAAAKAPQLAATLLPPPGRLGPDDPLPFPQSGTARQVVTAVNANKEVLIAQIRELLRAKNIPLADQIWEALHLAAESDDSALVPLKRVPRGPVVVDGSNVAWYDQNVFSHPQARIRPLREVRRALRRRGYFPVYLYADAPLPFTIDDPNALSVMMTQGEIEIVDSGTDADEVLLREAKRFSAPLLTNDRMQDWDPEGQVQKIQFTVSPAGEAHLLI